MRNEKLLIIKEMTQLQEKETDQLNDIIDSASKTLNINENENVSDEFKLSVMRLFNHDDGRFGGPFRLGEIIEHGMKEGGKTK